MFKINRWSSVFVLCISFTAFATTTHTPPLEFIAGRVVDGYTSKPAVGALVALYNANTDVMCDYSYTDNNGRFRLLRDTSAKQMYVVASLSQRAIRKDDVAILANIELNLPENKEISWWIIWLLKILDWLVPALIGLIVGSIPTFYTWCQSKRLIKRSISKEIITILNNKEIIQEKATIGCCKETDIQLYIDEITKSLSKLENLLQPEELNRLQNRRVENTIIKISQQLGMALRKNEGELHNIFSNDGKYAKTFGNIFNEFEKIQL